MRSPGRDRRCRTTRIPRTGIPQRRKGVRVTCVGDDVLRGHADLVSATEVDRLPDDPREPSGGPESGKGSGRSNTPSTIEKDGGGCTDAEREHQDRRDCESKRTAQLAQGEFQVEKELLHTAPVNRFIEVQARREPSGSSANSLFCNCLVMSCASRCRGRRPNLGVYVHIRTQVRLRFPKPSEAAKVGAPIAVRHPARKVKPTATNRGSCFEI